MICTISLCQYLSDVTTITSDILEPVDLRRTTYDLAIDHRVAFLEILTWRLVSLRYVTH